MDHLVHHHNRTHSEGHLGTFRRLREEQISVHLIPSHFFMCCHPHILFSVSFLPPQRFYLKKMKTMSQQSVVVTSPRHMFDFLFPNLI